MIYAQIMAVLFICPVNKFISILCHEIEHLFLVYIYHDEFDEERVVERQYKTVIENCIIIIKSRIFYICIIVLTFDIPIFMWLWLQFWWIFRLLWCDHGVVFFYCFVSWSAVMMVDGNRHDQWTRDKNLQYINLYARAYAHIY